MTSSTIPTPTSHSWRPRPIVGWTIRIAAYLAPALASLAIARVLDATIATTDDPLRAVLRWLGIAAAATAVIVGGLRLGTRIAPIAALYTLTLTFPDRAPSRFRLALKSGTTWQLKRRLAEARTGDAPGTPAEGAHRVLELTAALRVHDRRTRGHSERVRAYTEVIADELHLDGATRDRMRWAGLLHDVGKLYVSADILNKTQHLTEADIAEIKAHPERGRDLVADLIPWLGDETRAVWEHHERWDGTGYPAGLAGTDISLAARIVSVADAYDVMTSNRSYQLPMSAADARAELTRCAGTHFDPMVVRAFMNASLGPVGRAAGPMSSLPHLAWFPASMVALAGQSVGKLAGVAAVGLATIGATGDGRPDPTPLREDAAAAITTTVAPTVAPPPARIDAPATRATRSTTATTTTTTATTPPSTVSSTTPPPVTEVPSAESPDTTPPANARPPRAAPATTATTTTTPTAASPTHPPKSQRPPHTTAPPHPRTHPPTHPPKSQRPPHTTAPPKRSPAITRPSPRPPTGPPISVPANAPITVPTPPSVTAPATPPGPPSSLPGRGTPPAIAAIHRPTR